MPTARWRSIEANPTTDLEWASFDPLFGRIKADKRSVERYVKNATPASPILVASPDTNGQFLPPIFLRNKTNIEDRLVLRAKRTWQALLFGATAFLIFYWLQGAFELIPIWLAVTLPVVSYHVWNHIRIAKDRELIKELWLFTSWLYLQSGLRSYALPALLIGIGVLQVAAQQFGGADRVLEAVGTTYKGIEYGEFWRLLTGPLLHLTLAHWLTNFVIGFGIWFIAVAVIGIWPAALVLCISGIGSFLATYWLDFVVLQTDSDGIVGISGGLGGLLGLLLGISIRHRALFPQSFWVSVSSFATTTLLFFAWFESRGTAICHLSGFCIGGLTAVLLNLENSKNFVNNA